MDERPLYGGWVSEGVVRVGDTVRRPIGPRSDFVHRLLAHLESVGFDRAPRSLGVDEKGREMLTLLPGATLPGTVILSDEQLRSSAGLLRSSRGANTRSVACLGGFPGGSYFCTPRASSRALAVARTGVV